VAVLSRRWLRSEKFLVRKDVLGLFVDDDGDDDGLIPGRRKFVNKDHIIMLVAFRISKHD
jgi:hypothetical protein